MKILNAIQLSVSKIVKKQRFVKNIFAAIHEHGGKVLLVGGAVRDLLLEKTSQDLDFEVYGITLEKLQEILEQHGPVSFVGKSFGVLRLHGLDVDWSLPRKDSSGRHPIVAYDPYMSYEQAFIRRDLTVNAMGIDMQTYELIDLYGGLHDLQHKILRAPDLEFFVQDPLRLLRVMQFVGRFEMLVAQDLSDACKQVDVSKVSQERIEQEFSKLFLQATHPSLGLQWLVAINRFHDFFPGIELTEELTAMIDQAAQQQYNCDQEKLACIWSVIAGSLPMYAQRSELHLVQATFADKQRVMQFMKKLTGHQKLVSMIADLVWYAPMLPTDLTDAHLKWLAVWLSPDTSLRLLVQYARLQQGDTHKIDLVEKRIEHLGILDGPVQPLLTGKDLIDIAQGPALGKLVKKAYQLQIDQGLVDSVVLKNLVHTT